MKIMTGRYEFKYLLSCSQAEGIESFLKRVGLKKDSAQGGEYVVTSLYFDTPESSDYYDKIGGFLQRQKLRARIYQDQINDRVSKIQLETKLKNDMRVYKNRDNLNLMEWYDFCSNQFKGSSRFFDLFIKKCYKPHIVVRYKRRAYVDSFVSDIRLTIDSNIETCRAHRHSLSSSSLLMRPVCKGKVVMEIKFSKAMPWWFKEILYRFEIQRQAFSKYSNSVDVINSFNPLPK